MSIGAVIGRLGALALAVLLVAGALLWRSRGEEPAVPSADGTPTATAEPGVVRCARELGICEDLAEALTDTEVQMEAGVVTARDLQQTERAATWVTVQSLVEVAEDGRARNSLGAAFGDPPTTVATSPLVLVGWQDRLDVVEQACGVTWACVGEVAGGTWAQAGGQNAWGSPKPAWDDPGASGIGLLVLAQAAASRLDGAAVTPRNLDADPMRSWLTDLVRAVPSFDPSSGSQLVETVRFGRASRDLVGTTQAEAAEVLTLAGSRAAGLVVAPASPPVTARVVIAEPSGGAAPDGLAVLVTDLLAARGWDPETDVPVGPVLPTPLPSPSGEPPALTGGALEAVLQRFDSLR